MVIAIDATVGGANSNSYITLARSAIIAGGIPKMSSWFSDIDIDRNQLLAYATWLIDLNFVPYGEKASSTQALLWPQTGIRHHLNDIELSSLIIPAFVEHATMEWAWGLYKDEVGGINDVPGISELRTKNYWFKFNQQSQPGIPVMVTKLLIPYTKKQVSSFVRLVRV